MEAAGLALMAGYSVLLACLASQVAQFVPQPYMDEIFHIPQAQAYCAGNYTQWDPKITTLPGLYLFSVGLLRPLHFLISPSLPLIATCSVVMLRSVNLLIALTNLLLIHCLTGARHGQKEGYSELLGLWSSFNISLLPPLFFSSLLYYTDPLSTCLVLLTYTLHLSDRPLLASLAGVFFYSLPSNKHCLGISGSCRDIRPGCVRGGSSTPVANATPTHYPTHGNWSTGRTKSWSGPVGYLPHPTCPSGRPHRLSLHRLHHRRAHLPCICPLQSRHCCR